MCDFFPPPVAAASGAALLRDLTHDDAAMLAVALDEFEALIQVPTYVYSQKKGLIMLSDRTFFFGGNFFLAAILALALVELEAFTQVPIYLCVQPDKMPY